MIPTDGRALGSLSGANFALVRPAIFSCQGTSGLSAGFERKFDIAEKEMTMAATGLDVIDRSLHVTHVWLDEIMEALGPDRQFAWHVLGGVLRCLRDRLTPELAAHLGAQLPLIVRGAYYDRYQPSKMPEKIRSLDDFLEKLGDHLSWTRPVNAQDAFQAVCRVLDKHLEPNQAEKVWEALPEEIRRVARPG